MKRARTNIVSCLLLIGAASALAGLPERWSAGTNGLQLAISPARETWTIGDDMEFQVALRNSGTNDVFLNLGFTLANGRRHFPNSISLELVDSLGHSRQLKLVEPAGMAGRVDDYAVGLQTEAAHVLRFSLSEFWCPSTREYNLNLPKGHYKITGRFQGRGAAHKNTGMDWTAWNFWEGTLESGAGEFEIRDSRAQPDKDYTQSVENCLKDFESVKAGMTRGQVEGKLSKDGGSQGVSPVRFTHPACPYFKIDVEFEFKRDAGDQNRAVRGEADRVTKVSKPYIERPFFD